MTDDLYSVLGVSRDASAAQIKRAWRKLASRLHPDTGAATADGEKFGKAKFAYDVLSDAAARARYDATGIAELAEHQQAREEAEALQALIALFEKHLLADDPVAICYQELDAAAGVDGNRRAATLLSVAKVRKSLNLVRSRGKQNLLREIMERRLEAYANDIRELDRVDGVRRRVRALLGDYYIWREVRVPTAAELRIDLRTFTFLPNPSRG